MLITHVPSALGAEQYFHRVICPLLRQTSKLGGTDCSLEVPLSVQWLQSNPRSFLKKPEPSLTWRVMQTL